MALSADDRNQVRALVCRSVLTHYPTVCYGALMAIIDYTFDAVRLVEKAKEKTKE